MILIGVTGANGSGKTTIIQKIISSLGARKKSAHLHLCQYLKPSYESAFTEMAVDYSKLLKDIKMLNSGHSIILKSSIHDTEIKFKHITIGPLSEKDILFIESPLPFKKCTDVTYDIKVFVDTPLDLSVLRSLRNTGKLENVSSYEIIRKNAIECSEEEVDIKINNQGNINDINLLNLRKIFFNHLDSSENKLGRLAINPNFDASNNVRKPKGRLYVVSGPSGAGKTSLINNIIKKCQNIEKVIPYSTRPQRASESQGDPYKFISDDMFSKLYDNMQFLQYFEFNSCRYGIPAYEISEKLASGKSLVTDVASSTLSEMKKAFPNLKSIYIVPKTITELESRLRSRHQTDKMQKLNDTDKRLEWSVKELENVTYMNYDYIVINDNLSLATNDFISIINADRLSSNALQNRQPNLFRYFSIYRKYNNIRKLDSKLPLPEECQFIPLSSLNNETYKIIWPTTVNSNSDVLSEKAFFLRAVKNINSEHRISCRSELENLTKAANLGLYPKLIYFDENDGTYLAQFISDSTKITNDEIKSSFCTLTKILDSIKSLHKSDLFENNFSPINYIETVILKIKLSNKTALPYDIDETIITCHRISDILKKTSKENRPCHNDLTSYNLLLNRHDGKVIITDWECSGNYDIYWDLAKFSLESDFNEDHDKYMMKYYFKESQEEMDFHRLFMYKVLVEFYLSMWSLWQNTNKSIESDRFMDISSTRFQNCRNHINSVKCKESFQAILSKLKEPYKFFWKLNNYKLLGSQSLEKHRRNNYFSNAELSSENNSNTLVLIKPDIIAKNKVPDIIRIIENNSFKIVKARLMHLDINDVSNLYLKIINHPLYYDVMDLMTSGMVCVLKVAGTNVISSMLKLKDDIRKEFATDKKWNSLHCSDTHEDAEREIDLFFPSHKFIGEQATSNQKFGEETKMDGTSISYNI